MPKLFGRRATAIAMAMTFGVLATLASQSGAQCVQPYCPSNGPTATTGNATNITSTSATVTGTVDGFGLSTEYYFEYGTSPTTFMATTPVQTTTSSSAIPVSANIPNLNPNTTYYFQLVAQNSNGYAAGGVNSFPTSSPTTPPSPPKESPTAVTNSATAVGKFHATLQIGRAHV